MTSLPLTSLLSKALVAFTIEFDNEFEQRFPHTTTRGPAAHSGQGPWLVSMPMWSNLMRWLDADVPTSVPIERLIPLVNLPGLRRWGYVTVEADGRIAPTRAGRRAQAVWTPLAAEVEAQWAERFGRDVVGRLRRALTAAVEQLEPALPWQLPVSGVRNGEYAQLDRPVPFPVDPPRPGRAAGPPADGAAHGVRGPLATVTSGERQRAPPARSRTGPGA